MTFRETKLLLLVVDLAGYTRCTAGFDALAVAAFLDTWYRECARSVQSRGGRIVKWMGDGCLATFSDDCSAAALAAVEELERGVQALKKERSVNVELAANLHLAVVAEGDFGPEDDRRYDVVGSGVNHVFSMGGGAGVRLSEPVYRQLPSARRGPWKKHRPPATYTKHHA